jgi:serine/threonine protein kinase
MLTGRAPTAPPEGSEGGGVSSAPSPSTRPRLLAPEYRATLATLPREAAALIDALLAPRPEARPSAAEALAHPFFASRGGAEFESEARAALSSAS